MAGQGKPESQKARIERLVAGLPEQQKDKVQHYIKAEDEIRSFVRAAAKGKGKKPSKKTGEKTAPSQVLGYGLGLRSDREEGTQACINVYVDRKVPLSELERKGQIPRSCGSIRTDVMEIGRIYPAAGSGGRIYPWAGTAGPIYPWNGMGNFGPQTNAMDLPTSVIRDLHARRSIMVPMQAGISVGPHKVGSDGREEFPWAGTLGYFVRYAGDSNSPTFILSNNHVLANRAKFGNKTLAGEVPNGTAIIQPGVIEGPERNMVAKLTNVTPIVLEDMNKPNYADVAIAQIDAGITFTSQLFAGGKAMGEFLKSDRYSYQTVYKSGRTTGMSMGLIADLDANFWLDWGDGKYAWFESQIGVMGTAAQPDFGGPGDSGSLVLDYLTEKVVGLHFAGSDGGLSFVNPVEHVVTAIPGKTLEFVT